MNLVMNYVIGVSGILVNAILWFVYVRLFKQWVADLTNTLEQQTNELFELGEDDNENHSNLPQDCGV